MHHHYFDDMIYLIDPMVLCIWSWALSDVNVITQAHELECPNRVEGLDEAKILNNENII